MTKENEARKTSEEVCMHVVNDVSIHTWDRNDSCVLVKNIGSNGLSLHIHVIVVHRNINASRAKKLFLRVGNKVLHGCG